MDQRRKVLLRGLSKRQEGDRATHAGTKVIQQTRGQQGGEVQHQVLVTSIFGIYEQLVEAGAVGIAVGEGIAAKHEVFFGKGMVEPDREVVFGGRIGRRNRELCRAVAEIPPAGRGQGIQVQNALGDRPDLTAGGAGSAGQYPPARLRRRHSHE